MQPVTAERTVRIAVVGDVHSFWDDRDVRCMDAEGYDLILFVGDIAGYGRNSDLVVARSIAHLKTPTLLLPGNHDAVWVPQLAAEVLPVPDFVRDALGVAMPRRVEALAHALGAVPLVGYDLHRFPGLGITVLAARPHSLGGPRLGFRRWLTKRFGVRTLEESAARLRALFDQVGEDERVVVLAHCGPLGLGTRREDIFGRDFHPAEGDFGDSDLTDALAHARATRKNVVAVVAGHMHHHLRGGGHRTWKVVQDGVSYVNAARVPRRRRREHGEERHHVVLAFSDGKLDVGEVWMRIDEPPPSEHGL